MATDAQVPRSAVLITGMSGTGKSTALSTLAARGHAVLDTDSPGWILQAPTPEAPEPMWDVGRMGAYLDAHRAGSLFVAGCVANQGTLYGRFDAVVLLSAPIEVLLARVSSRPNPFGSKPEERARIAADLTAVEPLLRAGADLEIVTTASAADVAMALEDLAIKIQSGRKLRAPSVRTMRPQPG
jgi:broad-specificity NMP kinase